MSTNSLVAYMNKDWKVTSSYVHYDGYTTGVGEVLLDNYNTKEKAHELATTLGYASGLSETVEKSHEDRANTDEPIVYENYLDFEDYIRESSYLEYVYVWAESTGKWQVATWEDTKLDTPDEEGFEFLYNLDQNIKEMIQKWSKQDLIKDLEHVRKGEKEFIDKRGKISNHELPEPINLIGLIDSKKGTVRANHYHPIQEQKCLVTKGQFISVYQDLLKKNAPKITHVVNEGQLIVTKPNAAHAMVFPKDTVFLNLVRGEREHDNYGVTHTIKHLSLIHI